MYCKHCGKKIDDNSSFCKHCGKSQVSNPKNFIFQPVWIIYLIWVVSHIYLLMGEKDGEASDYFFPYGAVPHQIYDDEYYYSVTTELITELIWDKDFYDFSEFLVYVFIIPAIIFFIYRRFKYPIDKAINKILNKQQKESN